MTSSAAARTSCVRRPLVDASAEAGRGRARRSSRSISRAPGPARRRRPPPRAEHRHQPGGHGGAERGDPQAGRDGGADERGEARHRRGPDERSGQVVDREPRPRHRAGPGEHGRDDADAGDEAAEEDGLRAVAVEEALAALERVRPEGRERPATRQDRSPAAPPEPVAERVAGDRRGDRDGDDEREREVAGAGEHAGREQRGLTGDGDARRTPRRSGRRGPDSRGWAGTCEHRDRSCRGAIGPS